MIVERLRDHFGETLRVLYVLPDNPYEPAGDDEWIVNGLCSPPSWTTLPTVSRRRHGGPRRLVVRSNERWTGAT